MSRYRQTMTEALKQVNETTYGWTIVSKAKDIAKKFKDNMTKAVAEIEKLEKGLSKNPTVDAELRKYNEEVSLDKNLNEFKKMTVSFKTHDMMSKASTDLAKQGFTISGNQKALKVNGNGADLNKYATDLQNNYGATVRAESYAIDESADEDSYNPITEACWVGYKQVGMKDKGGKQVPNCVKEDVSLDEASLKDIFTANQEGKKVEDIAKKLKMSVADVKKILGEEIGEISEENLEEFTSDMIKRLKKSYSTMPQKLSTDQANALSRHLDRLDLTSLKKLSKENIPFLTTLARNKIYKKTGKFEDVNEEDGKIGPAGKIALAKEKDTDGVEKQLAVAQGKINILTQKLENEKNKAIKPVPNKETGEVPLTIGIANKLLKDKEEKESKKKQVKEEKRLYIESIIKKSRIKK
tara:strand:+ start:619 stop:1851 length:1233 start_codon:yes stop_codon:yes gene_type:complete